MNVCYVRFTNRIIIDGKSHTFRFKDTSLDSVALDPSDILPKPNRVGKLTFLLPAKKFLFH